MTDAELHVADPAADLLFGRPPVRPVVCPGCGIRAEPFHGRFCWCCEATGRAALMLGQATRGDRTRLMGGGAGPGVTPC